MLHRRLNLLFAQPGVSWNSIPSIEKQGLQVARSLRELGYRVTWCPILTHLVEQEDTVSLIRLARQEGFPVQAVVLPNKYNLPKSIKQFHCYLETVDVDVVCATGYKAGILTAYTPQKTTIEVLRGWTGHTIPVRMFELMDKLLLRRHDLVIAVSPLQRDVAVRYGVSSDKVWWIPNALDITRVPPPVSSREWCSTLSLPQDSALVGAVGRLSKEKGYEYLLKAIHVLLRDGFGDRILLLIAGEGVEKPALMNLTRALGILQKVRFLGEIPNGAQLISGLRLLVLSSLSEGMPNVILEAFAYKTPVVATAVGGVPELVKDGETGWLVPPRDPYALAQAIREALSNPEEARRRAENAYRHLLENFTVEKQAEAWERALQAAVENWERRRR